MRPGAARSVFAGHCWELLLAATGCWMVVAGGWRLAAPQPGGGPAGDRALASDLLLLLLLLLPPAFSALLLPRAG